MLRPVARGVAGGLLLSLVVVVGLTVLSGTGQSAGAASFGKQDVYLVSSATTATATISTSTTGTASTAGPPSLNAALSAATTSTISSAQPRTSTSVFLAYLPVVAALALGASAYLISRSKIEKEA